MTTGNFGCIGRFEADRFVDDERFLFPDDSLVLLGAADFRLAAC